MCMQNIQTTWVPVLYAIRLSVIKLGIYKKKNRVPKQIKKKKNTT